MFAASEFEEEVAGSHHAIKIKRTNFHADAISLGSLRKIQRHRIITSPPWRNIYQCLSCFLAITLEGIWGILVVSLTSLIALSLSWILFNDAYACCIAHVHAVCSLFACVHMIHHWIRQALSVSLVPPAHCAVGVGVNLPSPLDLHSNHVPLLSSWLHPHRSSRAPCGEASAKVRGTVSAFTRHVMGHLVARASMCWCEVCVAQRLNHVLLTTYYS